MENAFSLPLKDRFGHFSGIQAFIKPVGDRNNEFESLVSNYTTVGKNTFKQTNRCQWKMIVVFGNLKKNSSKEGKPHCHLPLLAHLHFVTSPIKAVAMSPSTHSAFILCQFTTDPQRINCNHHEIREQLSQDWFCLLAINSKGSVFRFRFS